MKITTWNINGLRARDTEVAQWTLDEKPDVLCLQELKASLTQVPEPMRALSGYHCFWHGNAGGYSGVALLVRKSLVAPRPVFEAPSFDFEGRMVVAVLGSLEVASVYVPNGGKDFDAKLRFLKALKTYVVDAHARGRQVLLCGDLNVTLTARDTHSSLVNESQLGQTKQERQLMNDVLNAGLVDVLRAQNESDEALFTWWAPWREHRERNIGWRIDYVLPSQALAARVKSCRSERLFGSSDHGPVTAVFDGPLFDAQAVVEGPEQVFPVEEVRGSKKSQLSLF